MQDFGDDQARDPTETVPFAALQGELQQKSPECPLLLLACWPGGLVVWLLDWLVGWFSFFRQVAQVPTILVGTDGCELPLGTVHKTQGHDLISLEGPKAKKLCFLRWCEMDFANIHGRVAPATPIRRFGSNHLRGS